MTDESRPQKQGTSKDAGQTESQSYESDRRSVFLVAACGGLSWLIYLIVARLCPRFAHGLPGIDRPIIAVLGLLAAAFIIYLYALRFAVRASDRRGIVPVILIFAVCFRLLLLFSEPIQEVDIYRYLWDGQVTAHGVSPFRYSPQQILHHTLGTDESVPAELATLIAVRHSSPTITEILSRVHFSELPTVYPPVSQAVFAMAVLSTPFEADLATYLVIMKFWIVLFDVFTIWLVIEILRLTSKPVGWSLAYAWCPLVLKEFANSGHLDSIAVCLTVLSVYFVLRAFHHSTCSLNQSFDSRKASMKWALASSVVLGLAVGAKLYPVVLAPLILLALIRRLSWLRGALVAFLFLFVSAVVCWPMLPQFSRQSNATEMQSESSIPVPSPLRALPPKPPGSVESNVVSGEPQDPSKGIEAFLSRWKMNDFLFLLVIENLTPTQDIPDSQRAWFTVVPQSWRQNLADQVAQKWPVSHEQVPFILARMTTVTVFFGLATWFCWYGVRTDEPSKFLEAVFLTLAWFWLLLPTQNPWYWIWALPFVPFARSRAWLVLSGLTLLYYLRFWFGYHWPNSSVLFTPYAGETFFDFVVTWIEFGPWFVWLAASMALTRGKVTVMTRDFRGVT